MARTRGHIGRRRQGGYTLLEIVYALVIVGVLSSIAVSNYSGYRTRASEAVAREDLRQAYSSAALYFMNHPQGSLTLGELANYGFVPSPNVEVKIIHGRLSDLLLVTRYKAPGAGMHTNLQLPGDSSHASNSPSSAGQAVPESRGGSLGGTDPGSAPSPLQSALLQECNREAQRALTDALAAARSYLAAEPGGEITKDILVAYGFTPNENVRLTVLNGEAGELSMSAGFSFPGASEFTINSSGRITSAG